MKKVLKKRYIFILLILISIGFAYLTSNLSLSGISSIFGNTWDVHFENVIVTSGSVQANTPVISNNDTSVTFTVTLDMPGDYYEFTVDAVNEGTIDAMLDTYTSTTLTEDQQKYLEYTATYADGEALAQYQELNAGDTLTYKIRLYYKLDIQEDDLPSEDTPVEITFTSNFIQADSNRIKRRAENTLYNVLKNEAESGGLALKYTGAHQDSMDASLSTKDIYHWYATNDTEGQNVIRKNNVIFANHCWQMIRTTDTGGVKLIYNGEVDNNQCLDTRGNHVGYNSFSSSSLSSTYYYGTSYTFDSTNSLFSLDGIVSTGAIQTGQYTCKSTSENGTCSTIYYVDSLISGTSYNTFLLNSSSNYYQFGVVPYSKKDNSMSYVGYMYNSVYPFRRKDNKTEYMYSSNSFSISTDYWYADSIEYVNNKYKLVNPYKITDSSEYSSLEGKYTFISNDENKTDNSVYYIAKVAYSSFRYIQLLSGNFLSNYNYSYTYGDSYTDNHDGTYTINNPSTIKRLDWYSNYSDVGIGKYVCKNAINNSCTDLWFTNKAYASESAGAGMGYFSVLDNFKYSNSFFWNGSKYILDDNSSVTFWNYGDSDNIYSLNNAHYTCWNSSGECTTLSFIEYLYYYQFGYIDLNNGKGAEDAVNEMLYNQDVNTFDSTIKRAVDIWFEKYLLDYSGYLENTIFCNDRSQSNFNENGWNPNGGNLHTYMLFDGSDSLYCNNITDRFSTDNNLAKLKYKVALISYYEMYLLNNHFAIKSGGGYWDGFDYWTMSPQEIASSLVFPHLIDQNGNFTSMIYSGGTAGLRPSISLKPGTVYSSGDGSMANPYVVTTN